MRLGLKRACLLAVSIFLLGAASSLYAVDCSKKHLSSHPQEILECYIHLPEALTSRWHLQKRVDTGNVLIETYLLTSQQWPKNITLPQHADLWQHELILYIPKVVKQHTAMLVVSGGTRHALQQRVSPTAKEDIVVANIAIQTQSIIAILNDVPNQYLYFEDGVPRKEDGLVAYTWKQFLNNPDENMYWPAHLPMTKAVTAAMDAMQSISREHGLVTDQFVVAGGTKRGWATWLSALADDRIVAIIPMVIDILNMQANIEYIHECYQGWPDALKDYVQQGVIELRGTPAFNQLVEMHDPLRYLDCEDCGRFKRRLSIPKYIISASGDDFFSAGSLELYFDKLPCVNHIRVIPNSGHAINKAIAVNAMASYYRMILLKRALPTLAWRRDESGELRTVTTSAVPMSAILWVAEAVTPDFRYLEGKGPHYIARTLSGVCSQNRCEYKVPPIHTDKVWHASFVEFRFHAEQDIMLTTPVFVTR